MSNTKKVVLVGHFNVGKSSMIRRFVQNVFTDDYQVTIGVHILKKSIVINKEDITLVIWDIEGKENIQTVRESYLIGTNGFIYVIDPSRIHTYQNLNAELKFLTKNHPKAALLTVANKSDLIDTNEFSAKAKENNFEIDFYSSAKTGDNVEKIFEALSKKMLLK